MTNNYYKGYDISAIQASNIPFDQIKKEGTSFIIHRCGIGNGGIDANYTKNIAAAKAAGLYVMAYNFIYPLPPLASQPLRDPIRQAQYHFTATNGELAACDFEWPTIDTWTKWGCSAQQINDWGLAYLQEYTRLDGRKPYLYTFPYFAQCIKMSNEYAQYPLWIASYEPTPTIPKPFTDWAIWQYGSGGQYKLPNGVPVDVNYAKSLDIWNSPSISVSDSTDPSAGQTSTSVSSAISQASIPAPQTAPQSISAPALDSTATKDQNIASAISTIWSAVTKWLKK